MRAVHVGVGHDDNLVVARLREVELFLDARPDRCDDRPDFLVVQHLVEARLFHVDDLAAQGQNGLEVALASLLGRTAGRVALHEIDLAERRVGEGAVGQLAGEVGYVERRLLAREITGFARRFTGPCRRHRLVDDDVG